MQLLFRVRDTRTGLIRTDLRYAITNDGKLMQCTIDDLYHEVHDYLTLEFWTGLTDCNGVKIFEGDWVRDSYGKVGVVVECDETCGLKLLIQGTHFSLCKNGMQYYEVLNDQI